MSRPKGSKNVSNISMKISDRNDLSSATCENPRGVMIGFQERPLTFDQRNELIAYERAIKRIMESGYKGKVRIHYKDGRNSNRTIELPNQMISWDSIEIKSKKIQSNGDLSKVVSGLARVASIRYTGSIEFELDGNGHLFGDLILDQKLNADLV